ncbi:hypothetical protein KKD57_03505 [Patescibacteria group bacterium]|nr:hypothetical protein [Patescibacteria group bacterium]
MLLLFIAPPSARKKFWPSPPSLKLWRAGIQTGKKEGGWGEGIFARLFCAVGAVGWEAFPPFGIKPNIKAKQFSNPFKRKRVARQIQKIEKKIVLLCSPSFGGRKRWGGVSNHSSDFRSKKVRASFSNCDQTITHK